MKKAIFVAAVTAMAVLAACTPKQTFSDAVENASYNTSTDHVDFSLEVEWPKDECAVTAAIRNKILDVLYVQVTNLGFYDQPLPIDLYSGDYADLQAIVDYYGEASCKNLEELAASDAKERMENGWDDQFEIPRWECNCGIFQMFSFDNCWVFRSSNYTYLGGAHGGVTGAGHLTFNKKDGSLVEEMLDASKVEEMQPLLRRGVIQYFKDCEQDVSDEELNDYLFIDDGIIPIPQCQPWPTGEGLAFEYQQYEIAAYALGMPYFVIPFDEIKPFLTKEAVKALGL